MPLYIPSLHDALPIFRQAYDGEDVMPLIRLAAEERARHPSGDPKSDRLLRLAAAMGSLPSPYLDSYYYRQEALAEACAKPTRSEEHTSELQSLRHLVCHSTSLPYTTLFRSSASRTTARTSCR